MDVSHHVCSLLAFTTDNTWRKVLLLNSLPNFAHNTMNGLLVDNTKWKARDVFRILNISTRFWHLPVSWLDPYDQSVPWPNYALKIWAAFSVSWTSHLLTRGGWRSRLERGVLCNVTIVHAQQIAAVDRVHAFSHPLNLLLKEIAYVVTFCQLLLASSSGCSSDVDFMTNYFVCT